MRAFVEGVGLIGPGLSGWQAARPVLAGAAPYACAATTIPPGELLPPAERRRTGVLVKLALAAGQEAMAQAAVDPAAVATVFASSSSDGDNLHAICESLARPAPEISPTRFHNSVHNAAAGYWGIATRSLERSTSLACFDGSFAAGLLEAAAQTSVQRVPVGLIAYDMPYPEPLNAVRRVAASFGVAFILVPERGGRTLAQIDVRAVPGRAGVTTMSHDELEALRIGVPAARSLPLLSALARGAPQALAIDYLEGLQLHVSVAPCN